MQYMIIEKYKPGKIKAVYERFAEKGRLMPEGLIYINSWIDARVETCYQVMESVFEEKLLEWIHNWKDLVDFEIIPVITSAEAKEKVFSKGS